MRSLPAILLALGLSTGPLLAQTNPAPGTAKSSTSSTPAKSVPTPTAPHTPSTVSAASAAATQAALERLTQSNGELMDLLKQQQSVLEDIQYDRRLQSRQIQSLEERLEETLQENAQLQSKVAALSAAAANPSSVAPPQTGATPGVAAQPTPTPVTLIPAPPPRPSTYLPPPEAPGMAGTMSWHRVFTLSGTDGKNSDLFHIQGRQWRVLWHNLDKDGKAYENTSALFISAFPKDDTIPQKVCSKLGTGGDGTELIGPGYFYLKIEASGGSWELAVEDFR